MSSIKSTLLTAAVLGLATSLSGAATITIANNDFQGGKDANLDPNSWTTTDPWANIYAWDATEAGKPAGVTVLAFMEPGNTSSIQQTVTNTNGNGAIFAETYGEWTVGFDYGWRDNTEGTDAQFTVSLIDLVTGTALASDTLTLSTTPPVSNTYTPLGTASLSLNYDNTAATAGNWVALRIERNDVADAGTKWLSTAWIDNVTATAVPEPSSSLLMGGFLVVGAMFRRRRA